MWPSPLPPASPGSGARRHRPRTPRRQNPTTSTRRSDRRPTTDSVPAAQTGAGPDQPDAPRPGLRSWSCGSCLEWHRTDPARTSAARRCSAPPQSPRGSPPPRAATPQPHLAGTVDPVIVGVDPRDLGLEGLVTALTATGFAVDLVVV